MSLLDTVRDVFEAEGLQLLPLEEQNGVAASIEGDGLSWALLAFALEDDRTIVCYSVPSRRIPSERRAAAAEAVTRLNYGLLAGTFELDLDDGEVRVRTSLDVGGGDLTAELVRALLGRNLALAERHLPGVLAEGDG